MSVLQVFGKFSTFISLFFGLFFFLFACKYYVAIIVVLIFNKVENFSFNNIKILTSNKILNNSHLYHSEIVEEYNYTKNNHNKKISIEPFISIHLPFYNEKNVALRVIEACQKINYKNYEIIIADDSQDETLEILKNIRCIKTGPIIKIIHRNTRSGFKGGALKNAVKYMNPKAKYAVIFDADFIPPSDILKRFLWFFEGSHKHNLKKYKATNVNNNYTRILKSENISNIPNEKIHYQVKNLIKLNKIGVVQGYQRHHLNKNENWITKGIRAEFSGGYMIERVAQEFFGTMKMIAGSVFMIRTEILKNLGWTHSITEDWDLTIRMYLKGYKVLYTPLIQAPAEIPTTIRALARQRMRWAEGHTYAIKKYFWKVMKSHNLSTREKLEFLYYTPYYLQSFFFIIGTIFWFIAIFVGEPLYFWSAIFGWCLIISNFISLPLMNFTGLYLEKTAKEDISGIFSFIILTYLLTPFQAYAALKGLLEKDEGSWIRTYKTGSITDKILKIRFSRFFSPSSTLKKEELQDG